MTLVRWTPQVPSPARLLETLERDLSRIFEQWPQATLPFAEPYGLTTGSWVPPLDIFERSDALVVRVDLPGLQKENIEVSVVRGTLTITGRREEERREGKARVERAQGSFSRSLALPVPVDAEKVTATYRNGVLEVTLPRHTDAKPRQIAVTA